MNASRNSRTGGHLRRGVLLSLLLHAGVLGPLAIVTFIMATRAASDVSITFQDVSSADLPPNLPPVESRKIEPTAKADAAKKERRKLVAEAEPEPEAPPPELTPPTPATDPAPPPPKDRLHEKIVDLDLEKDVPAPPDAKYLAQKNNRTEHETRATDTNLEKAQKGTTGSTPSSRKDERTGDDEDKIAQLEDQKSKAGRAAPAVVPRENPVLGRSPPSQRSLLAMRDAPRRRHNITPETADNPLPRDPDGWRELPEEGLAATRDLPGRPGSATEPRLRLSAKQIEYLFGAEFEAQRALASKQRSKKTGRQATRTGRVMSALENFIPEVKPGNQTELNTRAAPFAAFIARMHRSIHKLWGFGFLEDLESKPMGNPFNDPKLMTKLEIVLNGDGTIDKVTQVRSSGFTPFDAAAIDTVYTAGPYPEPPSEIRSANGKIYVHWQFHRDEHQCGTEGVDYFILNNPPSERDRAEPDPGRPVGASTSDGDRNPLESKPRAGRAPRGNTRDFNDARHAGKMRQLDDAAGAPEPDPHAARRSEEQVARADDPQARAVATDWFAALLRGDTARMLALVNLPFRGTGVSTSSSRELGKWLAGLADESPDGRLLQSLQVYSAAGARGVLGTLPQGFADDTRILFALARLGGSAGSDTFVLVLSPRFGDWKAVGFFRR